MIEISKKPIPEIRRRDRFLASPKEGMSPEWTEYQVVHGNKVMFRANTIQEAEKWAQEHYVLIEVGTNPPPQDTQE